MLMNMKWLMMVGLVAVVMVLAHGAQADPTMPNNLPTEFSDPNCTTNIGFGLFSGPWYYSERVQAMYLSCSLPFWPGHVSNWTFVTNANGSYYIADEICRGTEGAGAFQSLWAWVPYSQYNGQHEVDGRVVDEWIWEAPGTGLLLLDVLASDPNTPVRFIVPFPSFTSDGMVNATYIWSTELTVGPVDPSVFDLPQSCFVPYVCEAGPTESFELYLFHDANDFALINTNIADLTGDVAFVCLAVELQQFTYFSWLSAYNISMNTTWGQYELCNFGSCFGGSTDRVGHEGPEGVGEDGGQCTSNQGVGNWFSLPPYNESLCPGYGNGPIGINGSEWFGCGWSVNQRIKTINGSCLFDNGFADACRADGNLPYPTATKIWLAAFGSEDPTEGGCPEIYGSNSSETKSSTAQQSVASAPRRSTLLEQVIYAHTAISRTLSSL